MDTANPAEVTFLQSAIYFKKWQIARKSNSLYFPRIHPFRNVWLNLDESCGSLSLLKILASEILQSAPNDPKTELR